MNVMSKHLSGLKKITRSAPWNDMTVAVFQLRAKINIYIYMHLV